MSLFNNDNAQHLKEIWYPTLSHLGLEDTLQLIKSGEVKMNSAIHMQTLIVKSNTQDANEKEAFKELKEVYGCEAEEIVCCKYYVTRFWEEYGMEQIVIELLLIKEDGKIYIGSIG